MNTLRTVYDQLSVQERVCVGVGLGLVAAGATLLASNDVFRNVVTSDGNVSDYAVEHTVTWEDYAAITGGVAGFIGGLTVTGWPKLRRMDEAYPASDAATYHGHSL